MASSTRNYGLGYFDFGDPLNTDFSAQVEIDRFILLDKQLFGMMSIFGNGVIDGWEVSAVETFTVAISPGFGNLNFVAGRTQFSSEISGLIANSTVFIFARLLENTGFSENIEFIVSATQGISDPRFLLLAQVTVGSLSIESIDNSIRQEIEFLTLIKAAIKNHRHRGGSLNPSKIDLSSEVKGQLPSFRIADFDAEKITTGTFDLSRMPLLDHQELKNIGLLTHPQLDTFVKTLEISNKEIFGEIGTANLLQLVLAAKFIYDDPNSDLYIADRDVDEFMINELAMIPGITPNETIDFDATTAVVDLEQHFVKGIPPVSGTSFYITYDTELAWRSAHSIQNLTVVGDTVALAFNDADETNIQTIEGFESATEDEEILDDSGTGSGGLFKRQTLILDDQAHIRAETSADSVVEGFFSGKFSHQQTFRTQFVKEFGSAQDWSTFDSFVLHIKCTSTPHGAVKLFFFDSSGDQSTEYVILDTDEMTENEDSAANNFEVRIVDLTTLPFANAVQGFVIYTDDIENPFVFFIDFINIQRAVLLPEEGTLKLRAALGSQVTFSQIEFDIIEPPGTLVTVRARAASGTAFLVREDFTAQLSNGDVINLVGSDLEIEIVFKPDTARVISPILQSVRVLIVTEAEIDGFVINTQTEFSRGDADNIDIATDGTLSLDTPIYVDSYYFALASTINQVRENTSGDTPFVEAELAIFGNNSPISPNQVFKAVEDNSAQVTLAKLFDPRSVKRQFDRSFLVADTYNDRILQFSEDGELLTGIGSVNYSTDKIFPISAAVDRRTGILYIVWSNSVSFATVNMSRITLQTSTQQIQLIKDFDKILGLTTEELQGVNAAGQVMPVHLSPQNAGLAQQLPATDGFMFASNEVLATGIDTDSVIYQKIFTPLGIPLFVGNFAYINGIFSPTYVEKTDTDGFVITNGTVAVRDFVFPEAVEESITKSINVSSIIEVDKNNNIIFGSDVVKFSPFIPGRAEKLDKNTFLIGGLRPDGEEGTPDNNHPFNFRNIFGDSDLRRIQKETLSQIIFEGESPFVGVVILFDKQAGAKTFEYTSPEGVGVADVDIDTLTGQYVVAESSFNQSGRIIKLDSTGTIVFSFGQGTFGVVNSVRTGISGNMVIST